MGGREGHENQKIHKTSHELMMKFTGLTTYPVELRASGLWNEGDQIFYDEMMVYRVDIEAQLDLLCFFIDYKKVLKKEYKQLEIYMTRQQIELI